VQAETGTFHKNKDRKFSKTQTFKIWANLRNKDGLATLPITAANWTLFQGPGASGTVWRKIAKSFDVFLVRCPVSDRM